MGKISMVRDLLLCAALTLAASACHDGVLQASAFQLTPSKVRLSRVGATQQLRVFENGTDVTADGQTTFKVSNASVATVDAAGRATITGEGTAEVMATRNGDSEVATFEVRAGARLLAEATVGASGGILLLDNGTGVEIPAGALAENTTIRIEEIDAPPGATPPGGDAIVSPFYDFTPDGIAFAASVTISIGYEPTALPPGIDESSILVHVVGSDGALVVEGPEPVEDDDAHDVFRQSLDLAEHRAFVQSEHFSRRAAVARLAPKLEVLQVDGQDSLAVFAVPKTHRSGQPFTPRPRAEEIRFIVLHSTSNGNMVGTARATFSGEVGLAARRSPAWAHYYVGRDGTIVQVTEDEDFALHTHDQGATITSENSIGIEIFHNEFEAALLPGEKGDPLTHYTGRQISAVVRLCDHLIRKHDLQRPFVLGGVAVGHLETAGGIITHAEQDPRDPKKRSDPSGFNRTGTERPGSVSIEDIVYRALAERHSGLINTKGGDGLNTGLPGSGGDVVMETGIRDLSWSEKDDDNIGMLDVSGADIVLESGRYVYSHVIVNGRLKLRGHVTLHCNGIFYVGPQGVIDGNPPPEGETETADGGSSMSLTVVADGFALIEGRILLRGTDQRTDAVQGAGSGGRFTFRTQCPGPLLVPTIITRGGDADSSTVDGMPFAGNGGLVRVAAEQPGGGELTIVYLDGMEAGPGADDFAPDTLPPPPPFNQMTFIGTDPMNPPPESLCRKPDAANGSERLPLGRDRSGASVSDFARGVLTVGGIGGKAPTGSNANLAGPGGDAGSILVKNLTPGWIRFHGVDLFAGTGAEYLCYEIFVLEAGAAAAGVKRFVAPTGGLGGFGALTEGRGGPGGAGGSIDIIGSVFDPATGHWVGEPTITARLPVMGYNGGNPSSVTNPPLAQIGQVVVFDQGFTTNSTGGSGGTPGRRALGDLANALFGAKGADGVTTIKTRVFPE